MAEIVLKLNSEQLHFAQGSAGSANGRVPLTKQDSLGTRFGVYF